jgi:hypothetical protein
MKHLRFGVVELALRCPRRFTTSIAQRGSCGWCAMSVCFES